ncbi:MAG: SUF system Fe-S cluster assembly regulator [Oligoflexia bacterium]|nr:SUF system Fe-S cluster assembly regulator [Oligoflexia bacterium]
MLRLSKLTDYGIVLLTHFAKDSESVLTSTDLAERTRVPLPTVGKLLKLLTKGEILVSHRGSLGGYKLSREPRAISVHQVIHALEGAPQLTDCSVGESGNCDLEGGCPVQGHWTKLNLAIRKSLENLTLEDLTQPHAPRLEVINEQNTIGH